MSDILIDYVDKNKKKWIKELTLKWQKDQHLDLCFEEYCSYKVWVYTHGEEYFQQMKEFMGDVGEDLSLDQIKQDAWNVYLLQLGIRRKPFGLELKEKLDNENMEEIEWLKN